jgi:Right handed beta helix region
MTSLFRLSRVVLVLTAGLSVDVGYGAQQLPGSLSVRPGPGVFFVSTNGNDAWSGLLASPNTANSDGPFATVAVALKASRQLREKAGERSRETVTVCMRGGNYFLSEPLVIKPEDSGLQLVAYGSETPVLSGGRPITRWREAMVDGKPLWTADLPEARAGKWIFRELWVNGRRAVRARHPNTGYFAVAELPDKTPEWTQGHSRFRFRQGDLKPGPTLTNAEIIVMNRWVESRLPVTAVDEKDRVVTFAKRSVFGLEVGDLYYAEGALEFLDQPGEWYLDPIRGALYYWPRPGERMDGLEAIAPVLAQVLRIEGLPEAGRFVKNVLFRGLTFAHTEWCFPGGFESAKDRPEVSPAPATEVGGFAQAAIGVPGAVWGQGLVQSQFDICRFWNLGNYGLELTRGCQINRILLCEFFGLGAGGLKLGETSIRDQPAEQTRANEVSGCSFHDGGRMFHSAIGIWIGQSSENLLAHNLIHDFYYTGISIGWTWGYGAAMASSNIVAYNHVHHIGVRSDGDGPILSDMGGIYTLGRQPGTTILNNLWHDMAGFRYGGWGIYLDEGSSGILVRSNLVYRTTHGGFHQHYGETNRIVNNIFAFARDQQLQRSRPEAHPSFFFQTNLVYFDAGNLLGGDWSNDHYVIDGNLYFDARPGVQPEKLPVGPCSLEQWRQRGHDRNSVILDPLFVAPRQNDFRLQPNSPAFKLGFQPLDLSRVGP